MTHLCTDWRHLEIVLDLIEKEQLPNLSTIIVLDAVLISQRAFNTASFANSIGSIQWTNELEIDSQPDRSYPAALCSGFDEFCLR